MQQDVDYSVCKDDKKCKHEADRKMVKALDNGVMQQHVISSIKKKHWFRNKYLNN